MNRTRSEFWDETPETAREFHQADRDTFTGLYNHRGEPLHREPEPFGFHPNRWNSMAKKKKGKSKGC
jgi:hypothetical protein